MGRLRCCEKVGLKKGPWSPEEDQKLVAYIQQHGHGNWRSLPAKAGLERCGKSCRLRWINYLKPDIKRGNFTLEEDRTVIQLHALLGNKWSAIAAHMPGRTDNEIKNYWNTHLKKRLIRMGIDPITHKPKPHTPGFSSTMSHAHMAQWESARLEAEARESMLQQGYSSGSSQPARLIITKISAHKPSLPCPPPCLDVLNAWQNSPLHSESVTLQTKPNNNTMMHSMYAIMLATNDLESPTSTLCFPGTKPHLITETPTTTTGTEKIVEVEGGTVSRLQDDAEDIMVAVDAFRFRSVARPDDEKNIPEIISNGANAMKEGLINKNDHMPTTTAAAAADVDSYEIAEYGNQDQNCNNLDANFHYWNNLLNLDKDFSSASWLLF